MRGTVDGSPSPLPLAATLPAMLREDPFAQQLCAGLDEVLAPVLLTLDGFAAYLDVATAPQDPSSMRPRSSLSGASDCARCMVVAKSLMMGRRSEALGVREAWMRRTSALSVSAAMSSGLVASAAFNWARAAG